MRKLSLKQTDEAIRQIRGRNEFALRSDFFSIDLISIKLISSNRLDMGSGCHTGQLNSGFSQMLSHHFMLVDPHIY